MVPSRLIQQQFVAEAEPAFIAQLARVGGTVVRSRGTARLAVAGESHISAGMALTALLTIQKADGDSFLIEMADELGSITVVVEIPRIIGDRVYIDAERERMAGLRAQELAISFAEMLLEDKARH